jgi:hypothetical protein
MKFLILLFILMTSLAWSKAETDLSGNIETQARHSWNNKMAQDDLGQDWNDEDFYLIYGNLNGKIELNNSRIESNVFARYSHSDLYQQRPASQPSYVAPLIFTFPNKLVARDLFKLQHNKQGDDYREELILNKLYYERAFEKNRFMVGRMYINYGQGEIFNPINPFNQPTALTSISQVAQGNDGLNFTFYVNDHHTLDFYFLGDKSQDGYDGQINKTLWLHGEYSVNDKLQLDYVFGEDQQRNKVGGQVRYNFEEAMVIFQALHQSTYTDNSDDSHPLLDLMLGYDQQVTNKLHVRVEGGYQKKNRYLALSNALNERFLPTEYFVALAGQYDIHPLIKLGGTFVNDVKSGFTYFITRSTFDLGHNTEAEIFAYLPVAKGDSVEYEAQKLVTTDVGMALRTFF